MAADGGGVDVFRGSAEGTGVVGFLMTAEPGTRDVEIKVLIDYTADELDHGSDYSTTSSGSAACSCGGTGDCHRMRTTGRRSSLTRLADVATVQERTGEALTVEAICG
ncbi:hypothetical protein [Frankia sp. ACN1ag]|uniref:hypothetical protein n=1 Tax=Frankia sp. ACN1ag TaxID=102891 RepID=UPI000A8D7DA5|nr:hypothetical protein [Frankia sp. ACN1ag]